MFQTIVNAIIDLDLTKWERNSINNERLWKLQHITSALNKKVKMVKSEVYNVQRKMAKQIGDDFEKSDRLMEKKIFEMRKQVQAMEKQSTE